MHETRGRSGDDAKEHTRKLAEEVYSNSPVHRTALVRNLKTELGVATVKGNAPVFEACVHKLTQIEPSGPAQRQARRFRDGQDALVQKQDRPRDTLVGRAPHTARGHVPHLV